MSAISRSESFESVENHQGIDVKTIDGILYGWGEWRLKKQDVNGYASKTITALLVDGVIGFGRNVMKSMVPRGVMFSMDDRASVYLLVDGYLDSLSTQHKAVMLAYYSVMPKGVCSDEQRADKLGISLRTCQRIRQAVRDGARDYLQRRIFIA